MYSNQAWLAATLTVWPGCGAAARLDDALPALPREFVIVPDGDERPARAGILQVGIGEIALVDGAIAVDGQRVVEVAGLAAIGNARDLVDRAVVAGLHLVGILNDLVDEVAEVQHEAELIVGRARVRLRRSSGDSALSLPSLTLWQLTKAKFTRPWIVRQRRGDRAADAAAVSVGVGEAIPVVARRLESADQNARRPVRRR